MLEARAAILASAASLWPPCVHLLATHIEKNYWL